MYLLFFLLGVVIFAPVKRVRSDTIIKTPCTMDKALKLTALVDNTLRMCFYSGQFSLLLCNANLDDKDAAVVCRELGECNATDCNAARGTNINRTVAGNGITHTWRKKCAGHETSLLECPEDVNAACNDQTVNPFLHVKCPQAGLFDEKVKTSTDSKDGNWTVWSPWSDCTEACGGGIQYRVRTCEFPDPDERGESCKGKSNETQKCNTDPCPVDGGWSDFTEWTVCSSSCGDGRRTRKRTCTNPAPSFGGQNCTGSGEESERCNDGPCPVDGGWSPFSNWSSCSVICGDGVQERVRTCSEPAPSNGGDNCTGNATETKACNEGPCPVNGGWGNWSRWTNCSTACGVGLQTRKRACDNPAPSNGGRVCSGDATDRRACNLYQCPIDGGWSGWSNFSECNATCGGGKMRRMRTCTKPRPEFGGEYCVGDGVQIVDCNTQGCPVNGGWGEWKDWSQCSVTCGNGTKHRERYCDNPAPQNGGLPCDGENEENMTCTQLPCPVDGGWGEWRLWKACTKKRIRKCYRNVTVDGPCEGPDVQFKDCKSRHCNCFKLDNRNITEIEACDLCIPKENSDKCKPAEDNWR